jgi:hypothetical protein
MRRITCELCAHRVPARGIEIACSLVYTMTGTLVAACISGGWGDEVCAPRLLLSGIVAYGQATSPLPKAELP